MKIPNARIVQHKNYVAIEVCDVRSGVIIYANFYEDGTATTQLGVSSEDQRDPVEDSNIYKALVDIAEVSAANVEQLGDD